MVHTILSKKVLVKHKSKLNVL